jgi:hypothetical protein
MTTSAVFPRDYEKYLRVENIFAIRHFGREDEDHSRTRIIS